jgi:ferric-dicitrate binding protein FerR (iron transport regulator)
MENTATHYNNLISRYFYGEATPEEIRELAQWVKKDPANASLFSGFQRSWEAYEHAKLESSIDLDNEWRQFQSRVPQTRSAPNPAAHANRFLTWSLRIAAAILIIAAPTFFIYNYLTKTTNQELVARAGKVEQTLPDGTIVTLNEGASLSYPSRFQKSERRVRLEGEAWFEVAHDQTSPFIVEAGSVMIKVVGTSFLVNTRTMKNTREVILATGLVEVSHVNATLPAVLLHPGEKEESDPLGTEIRKSANMDINFLSWKTGRLVFNNTPLNEVVALLTRVYHKSVILAYPGLSNCRLTATFDRQSLESVFNVLAATLDLNVRETSAATELYGSGCKPQ